MPPIQLGNSIRQWVPRWWRGEGGVSGDLLRGLLAPASGAFRFATGARDWLYERGLLQGWRAAIPVISVGNLTVGGTGKTPVCAMIVSELAAGGLKPAVVLRGYGRDEIEVHRELNPLIPVYAARRRAEGIAAAASDGCDCAVLDDGFQHRAVTRDVDIVLVAAEQWREPRHLLPRGPWREPITALGRADLVLVTRKTASEDEARRVSSDLHRLVSGLKAGIVHLRPTKLVAIDDECQQGESPQAIAGSELFVVTTLAEPESVEVQLREMGAQVELLTFPDHHEFSPEDVRKIRRRAGDRNVVVTRKEAVKLRGTLTGSRVKVLEQEVVVEEGKQDLEALLRIAIGGRG